jgi:hypothetical protein
MEISFKMKLCVLFLKFSIDFQWLFAQNNLYDKKAYLWVAYSGYSFAFIFFNICTHLWWIIY